MSKTYRPWDDNTTDSMHRYIENLGYDLAGNREYKKIVENAIFLGIPSDLLIVPACRKNITTKHMTFLHFLLGTFSNPQSLGKEILSDSSIFFIPFSEYSSDTIKGYTEEEFNRLSKLANALQINHIETTLTIASTSLPEDEEHKAMLRFFGTKSGNWDGFRKE